MGIVGIIPGPGTTETLQMTVANAVNDPIDLRLQSKTFDGAPDDIVQDISERLVELVLTH